MRISQAFYVSLFTLRIFILYIHIILYYTVCLSLSTFVLFFTIMKRSDTEIEYSIHFSNDIM